MCCFSGPVDWVADTCIFARLDGRGDQFLVYRMQYAARQPVAMILPLPVASRPEAPLQFLSLKNYPRFFVDLRSGFPKSRGRGPGRGDGDLLAVQEVGDFVASYVPTIADFRRLDPRFTLPPQTWDQIPAYRTYGFAVFQLRESAEGRSVHPMALRFRTRFPNRLYFPTVHIHDGQVHGRDVFDHFLYGMRLRGLLPNEDTFVRAAG